MHAHVHVWSGTMLFQLVFYQNMHGFHFFCAPVIFFCAGRKLWEGQIQVVIFKVLFVLFIFFVPRSNFGKYESAGCLHDWNMLLSSSPDHQSVFTIGTCYYPHHRIIKVSSQLEHVTILITGSSKCLHNWNMSLSSSPDHQSVSTIGTCYHPHHRIIKVFPQLEHVFILITGTSKCPHNWNMLPSSSPDHQSVPTIGTCHYPHHRIIKVFPQLEHVTILITGSSKCPHNLNML